MFLLSRLLNNVRLKQNLNITVAADLSIHTESLLLLYNVTDCGCEQESSNR